MIRLNSHEKRMPKAWDANLRCGSKAAAMRSKWDVRFTPKSGPSQQPRCQLWPEAELLALFDHFVGEQAALIGLD